MSILLTSQAPATPGARGTLRVLTLVVAVIVIAGCATQRRAPVEDRSARPPPAVTAAPSPATVADGGPTYVVKRGDTLFQIALDTGLDYRELAAWNNIDNVNLIRVGQVLRLTAPGTPTPAVVASTGVVTAPLRTAPPVVELRPGAPSATSATAPSAAMPPATASTAAGVAAAPSRNTETLKVGPKAFKEPYSEQALSDAARPPPSAGVSVPEPVLASAAPTLATPSVGTSASTPAPAAIAPPKAEAQPATGDEDDDKLDWVWPAKGKVVGTFSETANLKGIDIAGAAGQPVLASAAGTVVYAGTGLRGYGKLIIVKHNKTYLSAYAHNREILVKEGEKVTRGQKIAEMGNTDASEVKLHFEIRRMGKPMDPARYLPPA